MVGTPEREFGDMTGSEQAVKIKCMLTSVAKSPIKIEELTSMCTDVRARPGPRKILPRIFPYRFPTGRHVLACGGNRAEAPDLIFFTFYRVKG